MQIQSPYSQATSDILQIKLVAVRIKPSKNVPVKRMQNTHAASAEMLKDARWILLLSWSGTTKTQHKLTHIDNQGEGRNRQKE